MMTTWVIAAEPNNAKDRPDTTALHILHIEAKCLNMVFL